MFIVVPTVVSSLPPKVDNPLPTANPVALYDVPDVIGEADVQEPPPTKYIGSEGVAVLPKFKLTFTNILPSAVTPAINAFCAEQFEYD